MVIFVSTSQTTTYGLGLSPRPQSVSAAVRLLRSTLRLLPGEITSPLLFDVALDNLPSVVNVFNFNSQVV